MFYHHIFHIPFENSAKDIATDKYVMVATFLHCLCSGNHVTNYVDLFIKPSNLDRNFKQLFRFLLKMAKSFSLLVMKTYFHIPETKRLNSFRSLLSTC